MRFARRLHAACRHPRRRCSYGNISGQDTRWLNQAGNQVDFANVTTNYVSDGEHLARWLVLKLEGLQHAAIQQTLEHKKPVEMREEDKREALELLRDPKLLERVLADFERCGVVGEQTNKLVGYLAAVSRKLDEPLAVVIQSSSAAGKSSLMDAVLALMPEEERVQYSAMTGTHAWCLCARTSNG